MIELSKFILKYYWIFILLNKYYSQSYLTKNSIINAMAYCFGVFQHTIKIKYERTIK